MPAPYSGRGVQPDMLSPASLTEEAQLRGATVISFPLPLAEGTSALFSLVSPSSRPPLCFDAKEMQVRQAKPPSPRCGERKMDSPGRGHSAHADPAQGRAPTSHCVKYRSLPVGA